MRASNALIFDATDASDNAVSEPIKADFLMACSLQGKLTGASTGAMKLQYSNDPSVDASQVTNWTDLSGATVTISAAGVFAIPKNELCYNWMRVVYTKNNGSAGTMTVYFHSWGF